MAIENWSTPLASLWSFDKMILTGERAIVNNDFARQRAFFYFKNKRARRIGFFLCGPAFRPQIKDGRKLVESFGTICPEV
ncbi:MAG: hypothetical protein IKD80_06315, partial [Selenomonadaceae bacterium]|nr:hypothetical protein [Selenomonadaceae bacterium]